MRGGKDKRKIHTPVNLQIFFLLYRTILAKQLVPLSIIARREHGKEGSITKENGYTHIT